jgi:hypothetical protein
MLYGGLTISGENETGSSLLVIKPLVPGELVIYQYQLEMLAHNPGTCILQPEIRRKDDEVKICYTISPFISLQEYLKNRRLTKQEFLDLLMKITAILLQGRELLLNERNFLLRDDLIQMDLKTAVPYLVYLPVEKCDSSFDSLKDFVLHLITRTASIEIKPGDHYLQRIIEYCKAGNFCTAGLKKLLNEIKFKNLSSVQRPMDLGEPVPEELEKEVQSDPWGLFVKEGAGLEEDENPLQTLFTAVGSMDIKIIGSAVFSQIALVVFCLAIESILKERGITPIVRHGSIGAFALVIDLILFKYLFSGKKHGREADRTVPSGTTPDVAAEEPSPIIMSKQETQYTSTLNNDETTLLACSRSNGLLIREDIEGTEKHELMKDRIVIGRKPDICDVPIREKSVGRIHAEIFCRNGRYYILDKHSKNGTFVNDERLLPEEEKELQHNDRVAFSSSDYRFHQA